MSVIDLRSRIFLAIGVTATACGGMADGSTARPDGDASSDDSANDGNRRSLGDGGAGGREADATAQPTLDATTDHAAAANDAAVAVTDAALDAAVAAVDAALDASADRGVTDSGGSCAAYGQACTTSSDCCAGIPCNSGLPCPAPNSCRCFLSIRRPFLVGTSLRVAASVERNDWHLDRDLIPAADVDPATAEALGRDFLRDACEEHASIAAFARFTMHLVSVGAPPEMIVASQRASLDEVRHARACFTLARRYGGRTMGPATLSLAGVMAPLTLPEIAALTAEEGCVGETLGALLAEEQLQRTADPFARSVIERANIVADEARHAELAWSFVAWAVAQGGEPVRRAVAVAIRHAVDETLAMPIRSYDAIDVDAWRAHGRLTCLEARAVAARGIREIVEPCAAILLGAPRPRAPHGEAGVTPRA